MAKQERREGNVRVRTKADGTPYWQARWWDGPVQHSKSFATNDAAEDFLRTVFRQKRDDTYKSPSTMTVSDLIDEYITRAASRISARTMLTYRQRAETMIDPTIGKRKLDTVTALELQRWIDALGRSGFKPSTIHAAVAVMMGALREAAMLGLTDRHLGAGIRRPTIRKTETATWTEDEVKRVLRAVRSDPIYGALYHVAIATGMRPGELRALNWADVNLETGVIRVRRTITRGEDGSEIIALRTKTSTGRAIAITPAIVERLKWHKLRQHERQLAHDEWEDLKLVFDRGDGHWLYASTWQKVHTRLCKEADVPRIRAHDLRHTSATLELEAGTHPKVVAERLGHSTISETLDRYSHVSADLQRAAADSLSRRLFDDDDRSTDRAISGMPDGS